MAESSRPAAQAPPTHARPTMADVAKRVGVSRALVSIVFRGKEGASPETRQRIFDAAAEIGYKPDIAAQLLRRRRSGHIGVLFHPASTFHLDLLEALFPIAERCGYDLALGALTHARPIEVALRDLLGLHAEAVLLLGSRASRAEMESVAAQVPFINVGAHVKSTAFDSVMTDDAAGARQAVTHLIANGHHRIAHLDGGREAGASERRRGYREVMRRHGLADHIQIIPGDYTETCGAAAARTLLQSEPLPTAVFAGNDRSAIGLMQALRRVGVQVPQEVSIVGFDDNRAAGEPHIQLTTVRQDITALAEAAFGLVADRIDNSRTGPRSVVVKATLVVRGTVAPPFMD